MQAAQGWIRLGTDEREITVLRMQNRLWLLIAGVGLLGGLGCMHPEEWDRWWAQFDKPGSQPGAAPRPEPKTAALRDTIGQAVTIEGLRFNRVRGYGLVVNLVDTGGSGGPEVVRKYLAKEMRRRQDIGKPAVPADRILEDRDTAMVEVVGEIPAAAEKGTRIDLAVRALGDDTDSLVGGLLVLCDLRRYAERPQGALSGKTVAIGRGPVFVTPFGREEDSATKLTPTIGTVLGGGVVQESRTNRLVLNDPSYSLAQRIRRRLNDRYGTLSPIADAISPSLVDLKIPPEFGLRKKAFLDLVMHTTLRSDRTFLEKRILDLAREVVHPDAEYDAIALAWEAIGKSALPTVQRFYTHPSSATKYYAARTGMRLGDDQAEAVVAEFAESRTSVLRMPAIEELGGAAYRLHAAGEVLRKLMDDSDVRVRIAAYRTLRKNNHPAIRTESLNGDTVILDVVDSHGPFLIYAQRSLQPRIAVFGAQLACRPPVVYPPPSDTADTPFALIRINADVGAEALTVLRYNRISKVVSPPLNAPLNVCDLIKYLAGAPVTDHSGRIRGLGVPYSEIVGILHRLCQSEVIPATLEVERPQVTEDLIIRRARERPETEY